MEKNKQSAKLDWDSIKYLLPRSLLTGFIGGMLWGFVGFVAYYFNFTKLSPTTYLIASWTDATWAKGWLGNTLAIVGVGCISVIAAFIYYCLFKRIYNLWAGIAYGLLLWLLISYVLHPIFPEINKITTYGKDTITTSACLILLYGLFVGYSISYDYYFTTTEAKRNEES